MFLRRLFIPPQRSIFHSGKGSLRDKISMDISLRNSELLAADNVCVWKQSAKLTEKSHQAACRVNYRLPAGKDYRLRRFREKTKIAGESICFCECMHYFDDISHIVKSRGLPHFSYLNLSKTKKNITDEYTVNSTVR